MQCKRHRLTVRLIVLDYSYYTSVFSFNIIKKKESILFCVLVSHSHCLVLACCRLSGLRRFMSQIIKNSLIVLSASVLFGIYPPAARGAYADGANAIFIILLTTLLRAASMTAFCIVKWHGLFVDREETKIAIRSGFIQACSIIGILGSLVYLPGPVAIVLLFTNTLMLLFFLWLKKELEVNQWLLIATVACLIGISFVVDVWNIHSLGDWRGYVLIMIGAAATASRLYIFGKLTQRKEPIVVGAETFLC